MSDSSAYRTVYANENVRTNYDRPEIYEPPSPVDSNINSPSAEPTYADECDNEERYKRSRELKRWYEVRSYPTDPHEEGSDAGWENFDYYLNSAAILIISFVCVVAVLFILTAAFYGYKDVSPMGTATINPKRTFLQWVNRNQAT